MLQTIRERLTVLLIALLPFHALAVTVLTKLIAGPNHAPLTVLASWKEAVVGLILLIALVEWVQSRPKKIILDRLDWLVIALVVLAAVISELLHTNRSLALLGFKYDLLPLVAFFLLRRVPWSDLFMQTIIRVIMWVGVIVAAYGIISFVVPVNFFYWLGYSAATSLYIPNGPLAAFQQIAEINVNRIQSTMSGPNQLGIWLLLPIAFAIGRYKVQEISNKQRIRTNEKNLQIFPDLFFGISLSLVSCLLFLALLLTFSRSAWFAAFVILLIAIFPWLRSHTTRRMQIGAGIGVLLIIVAAITIFPHALFRLSSTRGHFEHPILAVQKMIAHPFGEGLGSAGPAANRFSDTCVLLRPQDDPSWAKNQPNLCVFLGTKQVQPKNYTCNCPFLPENWYLQIGVEIGWIGFGLFVALVLLLLKKLFEVSSFRLQDSSYLQHETYNLYPIFLSFVAVSIAALFLHAWEDSAIAYSVWMLIATRLPPSNRA